MLPFDTGAGGTVAPNEPAAAWIIAEQCCHSRWKSSKPCLNPARSQPASVGHPGDVTAENVGGPWFNDARFGIFGDQGVSARSLRMASGSWQKIVTRRIPRDILAYLNLPLTGLHDLL